jgi:hypothetical protein
MHKLKEFKRSGFQIPMEIEGLKTGRSSENHGTVTKPASALSSGNVVEGSKEEAGILAEAGRCCVLKNLANSIEKVLNLYAVAS